jgi:hypothetical protein
LVTAKHTGGFSATIQTCATICAKTSHDAFTQVPSLQGTQAANTSTNHPRSHTRSCTTGGSHQTSANDCGHQTVKEASFGKTCFWVDSQRPAMGFCNSLQASHFAWGHMDKGLVGAATVRS